MTFVQIKPTDPAGPGLRIDLVGEDEVSGGAGGWAELARPRRTSAVEWNGTPIEQLVLPLLLTGMEYRPGVDRSIEPEIRTLKQWARKAEATGQPPVLQVRGPVDSTPSSRWVITDLAWGPKVRDINGQRVHQYVSVTFWAYLEAEILKGPARKWKAGQS